MLVHNDGGGGGGEGDHDDNDYDNYGVDDDIDT